jgi:hypothetical protein
MLALPDKFFCASLVIPTGKWPEFEARRKNARKTFFLLFVVVANRTQIHARAQVVGTRLKFQEAKV